MRDDHFQGILFDQPDLIDLVNKSRRQRALSKMLATKHQLQHWLTRPLFQGDNQTTSYIVVRRGKHYESDMSELASRFKNLS